jgi:hypothetical protein
MFRYAPGKWSVKVLRHILDGERLFCHRALRFARADRTPLPGFGKNAWVPAAGSIATRWRAGRLIRCSARRDGGTVRVVQAALARRGKANDAG